MGQCRHGMRKVRIHSTPLLISPALLFMFGDDLRHMRNFLSCRCNNKKSDCHPRDLRSIGMNLAKWPKTPTFHELQVKARRYPPREIHETWEEFLYFESEIVDEEDESEVV